MGPHNRYRLAWALLAIGSAVCLGLAFWSMARGVAPSSALDPIWRICCRELGTAFAGTAALDRFSALRLAGLGFLSIGAWVAFRRWAQTERFLFRVMLSRTKALPEANLLPADIGLHASIDICDRPEAFAFCYGYLRPRLCLSTGLLRTLSPRQVRAVLLHEGYHLLHRHPLRTLAVQFLADWLFFLPVIADLRDAYLGRLELEADMHAVEHGGRRPLAGALVRLLAVSPRGSQTPWIAITSLEITQARVRQLLGDPIPVWRPSAPRVAMTMGVVAAVCMALQSLA